VNINVVYFECPKDKPRIKKVKKVHSLKIAENIVVAINQASFTAACPQDGGHIIIKR